MKIGIIGATGAVGRSMLEDLATSDLQISELRLFASEKSAGKKLLFRGASYSVEAFRLERVQGLNYVLMSSGGEFSRQWRDALDASGVITIDNSSAWRMDARTPLIVPEVNGQIIAQNKSPFIANPNCTTIQLVVALKPLEDAFGLEEVNLASYQSVSGTGEKGIQELKKQAQQYFEQEKSQPSVYAQPIAFNLLPGIDRFVDGGHTFEEVKTIEETRKIMHLPNLEILSTTVRVPTFHCHGEAVTLKLKKEISRQDALECLSQGKGLRLFAEDLHERLPTPQTITASLDVAVSRVRLPYGRERSRVLQLWVIADNLKKGASTNAVQILDLHRRHRTAAP